jgi:hypothetical protein
VLDFQKVRSTTPWNIESCRHSPSSPYEVRTVIRKNSLRRTRERFERHRIAFPHSSRYRHWAPSPHFRLIPIKLKSISWCCRSDFKPVGFQNCLAYGSTWCFRRMSRAVTLLSRALRNLSMRWSFPIRIRLHIMPNSIRWNVYGLDSARLNSEILQAMHKHKHKHKSKRWYNVSNHVSWKMTHVRFQMLYRFEVAFLASVLHIFLRKWF